MKILRVRLDAELGEGLDRLKIERHVNLSAWVRSLIRPALAEQLGTLGQARDPGPGSMTRPQNPSSAENAWGPMRTKLGGIAPWTPPHRR